MSKENELNASDKLNVLHDKMDFIVNMVLYTSLDNYQVRQKDIIGFGLILDDLRKNLDEIIELMD